MTELPKVGFIGLGIMGEPMALNLARAGIPLAVWSRSNSKFGVLSAAGATVAQSPREVFASCEKVILMLADERAIDFVLERGTTGFGKNVRHRLIVQMGTVAPGFSQALEQDIRSAGGGYVEAPVSGSRGPAEAGVLIAMLAGERTALAETRPLLSPMCKEVFICGEVPAALHTKFAVNIVLITLVTGLAEAVHFAERHGLDLSKFQAVVDAGPMASSVSRAKLAKLVSADFEAQAAIHDVLKNNRLIAESARRADIASPLLDACHALFAETFSAGIGSQDMIAVIRAIEKRTEAMHARGADFAPRASHSAITGQNHER